MKQVIRKVIWNYEKEEEWLNRMSAMGLALVDYAWCRYVFEPSEKGQWTYRIELLENLPSHPESASYLRFLEENGVEVVSTYMRWIYLRKRAEDGAFDLYSDLASKLAHEIRVHRIWSMLMWVEFMVGGINLLVGAAGVIFRDALGSQPVSNLVLGCSLLALGFFFLMLDLPLMKKIKRLRAEQRIRE